MQTKMNGVPDEVTSALVIVTVQPLCVQ